MEKVLLVASLIGTVHLFVLAVGRFGHLAFSPPVATPEHWPGAQKIPEWHRSVSAFSLVSHDDGEEDWSKYDVPAFIRRGIPMPKLEVVQPKKPAKSWNARKTASSSTRRPVHGRLTRTTPPDGLWQQRRPTVRNGLGR